MIGIDKEALDRQVQEKEQLEYQKQEEKQMEANCINETIQYLEEQERLKRKHRSQKMEEYQNTLFQQTMHPKNNALGQCEPLDLEKCGSSSIQRFQGEDNEYKNRKKLQQSQLQRWCSEGVKEKEMQNKIQQYEKEEYASNVWEEDILRTAVQRDKEVRIAKIEAYIQEENKMLAEEKQKQNGHNRYTEKILEDLELKHVLTSPLYNEQRKNDGANSIPSDFKGFGKEKVETIIKSNESLLKEKLRVQKEEKEREEEWTSQNNHMIQQMEVYELQRKIASENDKRLQHEILTNQMIEQRKKQETMRRDRFGEIGYGFFQKFGKTLT
jgi:hypothetical protein